MPDSRDNTAIRVRWALAAVLVLTVVGAGFRFYGLGHRDFWFDESCTFIYVHNLFDWPEDSNLLVESTNLPYYAALRGWASLFGDSEVGYRSFSALLSTLTIPLLGLVVLRLGGLVAGVACAAIIAFNPLHIHYAHEARAYAMWVLLLSAALGMLIEAGRSLRWRWWVGYGVALFACLHLHYFTMYWVPATAVTVLLARDRRRAFRQWLLTHVVVGILFIPYFLAAVWPAARGGGSGWVADDWEPLTAIPRTLWAFLPAGGYPSHLRGLSILSGDTVKLGPEWLTAVVRTIPAVLMLATALYLLRRRTLTPGDPATQVSPGDLSRGLQPARTLECSERSGQSVIPRGLKPAAQKRVVSRGLPTSRDVIPPAARVRIIVARFMNPGTSDASTEEHHRSAHLFAAGMTLASLLTGWAYSLVIRPNYLVGRYDLVAWPACMIWFALLVASVGRQGSGKRSVWPALAICAAMLACSLVPIARMAALKPGPTFANVRAQRLAELAGSRDLAITFSYDRDYLLYYLDRADFTGRIVAYPSWLNRQVGWVDLEPDLTADMVASLTEDAAALVAEVDAVIARGGRVWLLLDSYEHRVGAHGRRMPWPRSQINLLMIQALKEAGFQRAVADEQLLLFTVHR